MSGAVFQDRLPQTLLAIGPERRTARWLLFLFWALVLIELVPLWSFRYIPTTDGPSHLYNAIVLGDYLRSDRAAFRDFFVPNFRLVPNWIAPALLTGLTRFLPPLVAEKTLLSIYLVLFPVLARYALSSIGRRVEWLALLILPVTANFYLHEGLYNYCFSLAFFFVVVGYWLRHGRHLTARQALCFSLLTGLLYFSHLIGFIMAGIMIAGVIAWRGDWRSGRSGMKGTIRTLLAAMPWILLAGWFLVTEHSDRMVRLAAVHAVPWSHRLRNVLSWMKSYRPEELGAAGLEVGFILCLTVWLLRGRQRATISGKHSERIRQLRVARFDPFIAVVAAYAIIFLISPRAAAGGSLIVIRLACFPLFALLFWAAGQICGGLLRRSSEQRLQFAVAIVSCVATVFLIGSHTSSYARLNPYLAEFADMEAAIPAARPCCRSTSLMGPTSIRVAAGSVRGPAPWWKRRATPPRRRGIVNLDNYEAGVDYFPLRYRANLDSYKLIADTGENFVGYGSRSGKTVDYVLVWTGGVHRDDPFTRSVLQQLRSHYRLIYTSKYSGYGQLYLRNN